MRSHDLGVFERLNEHDKAKIGYLQKKRKLESAKEIFLCIYLPIQLVIWSQNIEVNNIDVSGITMIVFTVLFALIISKINKTIWLIDVMLYEIEKSEEN